MMKRLIIYIMLFLLVSESYAQELNSKLTINTSKLQGVKQDLFKTMEASLTSLLNERKWTNMTLNKNEKIDCTFILTISQAGDNNSYIADLQVTSRRPIFNTQYVSPIFSYKDTEVLFDYTEGESLEFNETNISSNLVAVIAYYAYIIIGLDSDSFALNGGKSYFETALGIATSAQMLNTKGWTPFENDKNRYALALALTEESSSVFHGMWYNYHRLGLDEMANSIVRGRDKVISSTQGLQEIYSARPSSAILLFYGDAKLKEVVDVFSEATKEEKKEAYELLRKIYPTKSSQLDPLKK